MKSKVLRDFIDKNTMIPYHVEDVYESDDKARVTFLEKAGYLSAHVEEAPVEPEKGKDPVEPEKGKDPVEPEKGKTDKVKEPTGKDKKDKKAAAESGERA